MVSTSVLLGRALSFFSLVLTRPWRLAGCFEFEKVRMGEREKGQGREGQGG